VNAPILVTLLVYCGLMPGFAALVVVAVEHKIKEPPVGTFCICGVLWMVFIAAYIGLQLYAYPFHPELWHGAWQKVWIGGDVIVALFALSAGRFALEAGTGI